MIKRLFAAGVLLLFVSSSACAEQVKGRIELISQKAKTIQINVNGAFEVVRFDDKTAFANVKNSYELRPKDLISVEFTPGKPALKVMKVVFDLPAGTEIGVKEMQAILDGKKDYHLYDARPSERFPSGHLPTAKSLFAKELKKRMDELPKDKSKLLVFYCGGPTCPFTGVAIKEVTAKGYKNVKGFQAGLPGWRKAKKPVHASAKWLAKNLDEHTVLIDTRSRKAAESAHIKSAVSVTREDLVRIAKEKPKKAKRPSLPGVQFTGAPIVLYGDTVSDEDLLEAYQTLLSWKYKRVTILEGGFEGWKKVGYPVEHGSVETKLSYVKKLVPGALPPTDFLQMEKKRDSSVVFLDVRSETEIKEGAIKDTVNIPLDEIEARLGELPKDKEIIPFCSNGARAQIAYELLKKKGFRNVRYLNETISIEPDGSYTICCVPADVY